VLNSLREFLGYIVVVEGKDYGKCTDFLFDSTSWKIIFLNVESGTWLGKTSSLISSAHFGTPDQKENRFPVKISKSEVEYAHAPSQKHSTSVRSETDIENNRYLKWPYYLGGKNSWARTSASNPPIVEKVKRKAGLEEERRGIDNQPLLSCKKISGYRISSNDSEFGVLYDFIVDESSWTIRYLVLDMIQWFPSRLVLVLPSEVSSIGHSPNELLIDLSKEEILASPKFSRETPVTRDLEIEVYDHYNQIGYWEDSIEPPMYEIS
jgi:uncharacterized protein YrrD